VSTCPSVRAALLILESGTLEACPAPRRLHKSADPFVAAKAAAKYISRIKANQQLLPINTLAVTKNLGYKRSINLSITGFCRGASGGLWREEPRCRLRGIKALGDAESLPRRPTYPASLPARRRHPGEASSTRQCSMGHPSLALNKRLNYIPVSLCTASGILSKRPSRP
jgi:hypothetical protein